MVEGECVPGEATVRQERRRDALEAAATIGPGGQMQQRPPGAVDQGRGFLEFKFPYVTFAQVELDPLLSRAQPCLREHPPRRVNPDHKPARCLSDRDRNSPGTNRKLDQWPVSLKGKPDVERNVSTDASRRLRVSVRPSVVPTRHRNTIYAQRRPRSAARASVNVPRPRRSSKRCLTPSAAPDHDARCKVSDTCAVACASVRECPPTAPQFEEVSETFSGARPRRALQGVRHLCRGVGQSPYA